MKSEHDIGGNALKRMRNVDIRSVKPDELVDISSVVIRRELPREDRIRDYLRQIGNPYCYKCHGVTVKISFAGEKKLEDCIRDAILI